MKTLSLIIPLSGFTIVLFSTTMVSVFAQESSTPDVDLLKGIKVELQDIESSLDTLVGKFESFSSTTISTESTATSSESTTTTASTPATSSESTTTTASTPATSPESTTTASSTIATSPDFTTTAASTPATSTDSTTTAASTSATSTTTAASTPATSTTTAVSTPATSTTTAASTTPTSTESTITAASTSATSTTTAASTPATSTTTAASTPATSATTAASTTPTSTESTTTAASASDQSLNTTESLALETKSQEEKNEVICVPSSIDDLCNKLILVLKDIEKVTNDLNEGKMKQSHLDQLKDSSTKLDEINLKADKTTINQLNLEVFKNETKRIEGKITTAIIVVDKMINNEGGRALVIVIGILGGLIFLSLLALAAYAAMQRSQRMKKDQLRKMNETRIPTDSSAEEGNVNKGFVEEKLPKVSLPPRFDAPSRTPYPNRREDPRSGPSWEDSMDRQSDRRPYDPPISDYDDDPFSLERRGANIKRAALGGLRRYDP